MTSTKSTTPEASPLLPEHQRVLVERGIPVRLAELAGLRSVNLADMRHFERRHKLRRRYQGLPSHPVNGILIPYPNCLDGVDRCRVRVDQTRYIKPSPIEGTHHGEETIEIPRYVCQAAVSVVPYIVPGIITKVAADVSKDIYIVEAPLKALALIAHGMLAIGLGGVLAGAHDKHALDSLDEVIAHDELKRIKWKGRTVYVVFDAGLNSRDEHEGNPMVALGAARVWKALGQLGAKVKLVAVPYYHPQDSSPEDGKLWWGKDQGPDDFIVRQGVDAFKKLVDEAVLADPKERLVQALATATSATERNDIIADLLRELSFVATLAVLSKVELKAVAAITKIAGIGVRDLKEAADEFHERLTRRAKSNEPKWTEGFVTTQMGIRRPLVENVELALRHDAGLAGLVAFDEFAYWAVFRKTPPWIDRFSGARETEIGSPWTDIDDTRLALYLAEHYQLHDIKPEKIRAALEVVARDHFVHPVREYLQGLTWDGTGRVKSWLSTYFGVTASEYTSKVGTWWLVSAVARIMKPGTKVDHTLILEGEQGLAKSTALQVLGDEWFSDGDLGDLRSKEAAMLLQGVWIQELPEGEIFSRATTRALKAFTTKTFDNIIPKFSNRRTKLQRQTVFALTTNDEADYLVDSTGNRRYWPVRCTAIDLDKLAADRDQLWAEAVALYKAGEKWWPTTDEEKAFCKVEQEERRAHDPWEDLLLVGLREHERATIAFVLGSIFNIPVKDQKRTDQLRAAACLRAIGWVEGKRTGRARHWVRGPDAEPMQAIGAELADAAAGARHLRLVDGGMDVADNDDLDDVLDAT